MRKTIKYSSPGLVLAAVALVVALGGTSVAGGGAQTSAKAIAKVNQVNQSITVPPQSSNVGVLEATVNCPNGTTVVGGGVTLPSGTPATATDMFVAESGPAGNGWRFASTTTERRGPYGKRDLSQEQAEGE